MKVLYLNSPLVFSVIPRTYDIDVGLLSLQMREEMIGEVLVPTITAVLGSRLEITITTEPTSFKTQQKYEIVLLNDGDLIYNGKLIVLDEDTDVQNYTYGSQTTSRFGFKQ